MYNLAYNWHIVKSANIFEVKLKTFKFSRELEIVESIL